MTMEYVSLPGETVPPVPDGPRLCDGDDMRILHNAFLWGYQEASGLVRGAPPGDVARSGFLGQWLADLDATLHTHHEKRRRAPVGQARAARSRLRFARRPDARPPRTDRRATRGDESPSRLMAHDGGPDGRRPVGRCLRAHARGPGGAPAPRSRRGRPGRRAGGHARGIGGDGGTQRRGDPEEPAPTATRDVAGELHARGPQAVLRGHAALCEGALAPRGQAPIREAVPAAVPGQAGPTDHLTARPARSRLSLPGERGAPGTTAATPTLPADPPTRCGPTSGSPASTQSSSHMS